MRRFALLVLLGATPAWAQHGVVPDSAPEPAGVGQEEPHRPEVSHPAAAPAWEPAPEFRAVEPPAAARAQPSLGNFVYHVLLTAVSALVTALIWRAVT